VALQKSFNVLAKFHHQKKATIDDGVYH